MQEKWYDNDWLLCILAVISIIAAVMGNNYINGGHIVW